MNIHVYSVCRNEETLLPYFLRHYGSFSERIVIVDDGSTDRSRDIIAGHPKATCIPMSGVVSGCAGKYSDALLVRQKNEAYKASRGLADWVVVVDIDEFLYHPDLVGLLLSYKNSGVTLPAVEGFDMVAEGPPVGNGQIFHEVHCGFHNPYYSKNAVFAPDIDIDFDAGCHTCQPKGRVRASEKADIKLLHYRFLGASYFVRRTLERNARLSDDNIKNGWATRIVAPGTASLRAISNCTSGELTRHYYNLLKEQRIERVVHTTFVDVP